MGWDAATRQRNLPLVVNHARYLILPWIRIPRWPPTCWPASNDNSPTTGSNATANTTPGAVGNALRDAALRGHLLSRRQLDPSGPDARPRQARYASRVQPACQQRIRQTPLPGLEANPQPLVPQPYFTARSNNAYVRRVRDHGGVLAGPYSRRFHSSKFHRSEPHALDLTPSMSAP